MLRRIQTVWLLLATVCSGLCFKLPFYTGDWQKDLFPAVVDLNAKTTLGFTIMDIAVGVLALVSIFLFKNRKTQLQTAVLGLLLSLVMIVLFFIEMTHFNSGTIALWIIDYLAIPVFFFLALRGIRKDINLIRGLDRLR